MVQHRPALGLRHRRSRPGPLLRGLQDRQADQVQVVLRAPAAACLLHPGRRGRPGERGRHHGPVGARGAPVQVRLRHRLQLLQAARRGREALRRRPLVRPHELPQDRRPGRRRDQVGRHHAPRREDGRGRRRSPGHRELYRLEGEGGAEGRGARHRLQARRQAPQGHHEGLRELRGRGRCLLRSGEEPGSEEGDQDGAPGHDPGQLHQARHPVRQAGLHRDRLPGLRHGLGFGSLPHGLRPELQQLRLAHRRLPARRRERCRLAPHRPQGRQGGEDAQGPRPVGADRPRRLGLGRSGPALQHHHERLAHQPRRRTHPGVEPVLGIHVPRRHGVQSGLGQPAAVLRPAEPQVRRRILRACLPPVDGGARNLGDDGAVPVEGDRAAFLRVPHAGPRLRQYRRPAHDHGPALR